MTMELLKIYKDRKQQQINMKLKGKKIEFLILFSILLLGFVVRLYRFDGPVADWHSWRQADTSAVSRNFVAGGFDLLHPKFDDLSNVPSGIDNPNGYRFVEFPIYNVLQAGAFSLFYVFTLEQWGRLISIFASIFSALFLYLLIKKRFGYLSGVLTSFFFLFIPFNIYFSRTILPDPLMVAVSLGGIYFFQKWLSEDLKLRILDFRFIASVVLTICAFLLKPYALFFTLPMVYIAYEHFGFSFLKKWQLWLFLIISIIPLSFWRIWMQAFPEGIASNAWLFNEGNIRFKGAFFYWIFADRIGRLILGYWGVALLVLGFLAKYKTKDLLFVLSFVLSSLIYIVVMARGNVQHDYYQILIIPSICILLGIGATSLLRPLQNFNKYVSYTVFLVCTLFMLFFGWYFIRDYFNINNPSIVAAGEAVDKLIPKDAKIIANYTGDTSFLYQTKRKGWASFQDPLPVLIKKGADYLVLVNPKPQDYGIGKEYKIVSATSDYILFDLRKKP